MASTDVGTAPLCFYLFSSHLRYPRHVDTSSFAFLTSSQCLVHLGSRSAARSDTGPRLCASKQSRTNHMLDLEAAQKWGSRPRMGLDCLHGPTRAAMSSDFVASGWVRQPFVGEAWQSRMSYAGILSAGYHVLKRYLGEVFRWATRCSALTLTLCGTPVYKDKI